MEEIMIYPYCRAYEPYVLNSDLIGNNRITALVSPKGWGLEGGEIACGEKYLTVLSDFSRALEECTAVWFVDDEKDALPETLLKERLSEAIAKGKKIIFTRYNDAISFDKSVQMIPHGQNITPVRQTLEVRSSGPYCIHRINTPVLAVYGLETGVDKLAVQIALRRQFMDMGYKVASVASRLDSDLLGMYSIPGFMFSNRYSESEKIIKYNHFIKAVECRERPDLIIVGIPGGVFPFNEIDDNNFGILAYEISFAVSCDAAVMCMAYNPQFSGEYDDIKSDVTHRLGFHTVCCHIAAAVPDTQDFFEKRKRHLVSIDRKYIDRKKDFYEPRNIYNMQDKDSAKKAAILIRDVLS
ncbi:MAG: TIGR04066 family peptide maturation system protein [Eubacteriales bacterium]|nr:TIGR04066 family peptide maturation system protein [Eubacteriales bacterium]